jgi:hypothetical protein
MLRSRRLNQSRNFSDEREVHSTTISDLRDKLRIENRLRKSSKTGGSGMLERIKGMTQNMNESMRKQSSKMPDIFDTRAK